MVGVVVVGGMVGWGVGLEGVGARVELEWSVVVGRVGVGVVRESEKGDGGRNRVDGFGGTGRGWLVSGDGWGGLVVVRRVIPPIALELVTLGG